MSQDYYEKTDKLISNLGEDEKRRLKFVQDYLARILLPGVSEIDKIQLGPMDIRMLEYLILTVVLEYDSFRLMSEK